MSPCAVPFVNDCKESICHGVVNGCPVCLSVCPLRNEDGTGLPQWVMVSLSSQSLDLGVVTKFVTDPSAGGVSMFIGEPSTNWWDGLVVRNLNVVKVVCNP